MKICTAQTRPVKGDVQKNIANHKKFIEIAVSSGADIIIFPELSLTGYEPALAKELAAIDDDGRLDEFQKISDAKNITIGAGMPTRSGSGIHISMIIFQPNQKRQAYSKQYLHSDEFPYFAAGRHQVLLHIDNTKCAPAICYESSVPVHSENAFNIGAEVYLVSVADTAGGAEKDHKNLSAIAKKYSMTVAMSNCIGPNDNFVAAGRTSIWNNKGVLMGQFDDTSEGLLVFDTETGELIEKKYERDFWITVSTSIG